MLTLPDAIIPILNSFSTLFQVRTWLKAQILLVGAILSPGKRTVSSALRVMGLSDDVTFAKYHHVLNRAIWSSLQLSRVLLGLLLDYLDSATAPLVFGIDETLERRRGQQIKAKGIYRDGVRSSKSQFVKASGLRWISLMWLTPIPWAGRVWALPVLTALAPSERYYQQLGRGHQKLTDAPLAAPPASGAGGGQHLRCPGTAAFLPVSGSSRHLHYPTSAGCGAVRASPTQASWTDGASPP